MKRQVAHLGKVDERGNIGCRFDVWQMTVDTWRWHLEVSHGHPRGGGESVVGHLSVIRLNDMTVSRRCHVLSNLPRFPLFNQLRCLQLAFTLLKAFI